MGASEKLLAQVTRKLRVTWDDPDTKALIEEDIIPSAEAVLSERIGIPSDEAYDYSIPGTENELLLALCFYKWNDAEDEFYANYECQIAEVRRKWEVMQFAEEAKEAADL